MNIGIFTDTYYPEVNGVANSVYQLKQGLERRGHTVYIFTVSNPDMENIVENNVPISVYIFSKCLSTVLKICF